MIVLARSDRTWYDGFSHFSAHVTRTGQRTIGKGRAAERDACAKAQAGARTPPDLKDVDTMRPDQKQADPLSHAAQLRALFSAQKKTLDLFLERGAISRQQHDKSIRDLKEKMGISDETD